MTPRFNEFDQVPFKIWLPMWLDYIGPSTDNLSPQVHQHTYARIRSQTDNLLGVMAVTDRPVAFAHYYFHPSSYSLTNACTLEDLYVVPHARGAGLGRSLIEWVAERARLAGAPVLNWKTRASNTSAMLLYDKLATRTDYSSYRMAL